MNKYQVNVYFDGSLLISDSIDGKKKKEVEKKMREAIIDEIEIEIILIKNKKKS